MSMIKSTLGTAFLACIILAATAQADEAKGYSFKVDNFTWVDTRGCVATLNGGKTTEVVEGVDKEDCAKVSSVVETSVNVQMHIPTGMTATFKSPTFGSFVCWYKDTGSAASATCND